MWLIQLNDSSFSRRKINLLKPSPVKKTLLMRKTSLVRKTTPPMKKQRRIRTNPVKRTTPRMTSQRRIKTLIRRSLNLRKTRSQSLERDGPQHQGKAPQQKLVSGSRY